VKAKRKLSLTQAEDDAIAWMLARGPEQRVPS